MSLSYPYLRKPRKDREDLEFRGEKICTTLCSRQPRQPNYYA
jgi:hypothetical protein